MGDMNVQLWSRLSYELLERVLACLSVPVLCRFRTVCKRWNGLICNPAFGALCARRATQHPHCFVVARYAFRAKSEGIDGHGENHGWSFLDVNARRWYTIKRDDRFENGSVAMDGGLVCQVLGVDEEDVSVYVSNPIAKTSRRLQPAPNFSVPGFYSGKVDMVVDNIAHTYKIFLMPSGEDHGTSFAAPPPPMVVYESTTDQWRTTTGLPLSPSGDGCYVRCSVFFDGLLYCLMCRNGSWGATKYWLWSYNHVEDTWKDTCVSFQSMDISPQLLVSDNRLFFASWLRVTDGYCPISWSYEVSEVLLAKKTRRMVFHILGNEVAERLNILHHRLFGSLHAIGFGNAILLTCKSSGVSRMYDLGTCSWAWLPKNPLVPLTDELSWVDRQFWLDYGRPINLSLPASTLWMQ